MLKRALLLLCFALAAMPAAANDGARLMAAAAREAAAIAGLAERVETVFAIARIQAEAGLKGHGRDALRQVAEAVHAETQGPARRALRGRLLAATAEVQCELGLKPDAGRVLDVAARQATGPAAQARVLQAALFCGDRRRAAALERQVSATPSDAALLALAASGLPARATALADRFSPSVQARRRAASSLAAIGYGQAARKLAADAIAPPSPAAMLAAAETRRRAGDRRGAAAFLKLAEAAISRTPALKPALAAAYAENDDAAAAARLVHAGGDAPATRAAIAAAFARAGDTAQAEAWARGLKGVDAARPLAALARLTEDPEHARQAARHADAAPAGRARAEALAYAAAAALARAAR